MEIAIIILLLALSGFLYFHIKYLQKMIENEKKIQTWSMEYNHALKMNRESLLTQEQLKSLLELDSEDKEKYEKLTPNVKGF